MGRARSYVIWVSVITYEKYRVAFAYSAKERVEWDASFDAFAKISRLFTRFVGSSSKVSPCLRARLIWVKIVRFDPNHFESSDTGGWGCYSIMASARDTRMGRR